MPRFRLVVFLLIVTALAGCSQSGAAELPTAPAGVSTQNPVATSPAVSAATAGPVPTNAPMATAATVATTYPAVASDSTATPVATTTVATSTTETPTGAAALTTPSPAAPAPASVPAQVGLQQVAEGLTAPVALAEPPDGSGRLFVVDQTGVIRIISRDHGLLPEPFLDLRDRMVRLNQSYDERGLLGLAFHPQFRENGRFFVFYSAPLRQGGPAGWDNTMTLSEFSVSSDSPDRADPGSEKILMQVDEPQANHEGGTVTFGPDGFMYMSLGDGGGANDTSAGHTPNVGNAQDLSVRLGKILRIDVNGQQRPYGIPSDNPFRDGKAPEIYAFGLRNPYRISFDMGGNHELYAADAGQNLYEEVDVITRGGNYGWNIKEGTHCFTPQNPSQPPASCPQADREGRPLVDPVIEYSHKDIGIAVVGGYVYRGQALPGLVGHYVFGDWSTSFGSPDGTLLVAQRGEQGQGLWKTQELGISTNQNGRVGHYVLGLGQDRAGEMYLLTTDRPGPAGNTGRVLRIVPAS